MHHDTRAQTGISRFPGGSNSCACGHQGSVRHQSSQLRLSSGSLLLDTSNLRGIVLRLLSKLRVVGSESDELSKSFKSVSHRSETGHRLGTYSFIFLQSFLVASAAEMTAHVDTRVALEFMVVS